MSKNSRNYYLIDKNYDDYLKRIRVLYIENDTDTLEFTSLLLDDIFSELIVAKDGQEGVEKFEQCKPDLIITDINLPLLNGLSMIELIRHKDKDIPIIILSAYDDNSLFLNSIKLGIDGFLLKPLDMDSLVGILKKVVDKLIYSEKLKSNIKFLNDFVDATNSSSIISKANLNGVITYVNDEFCKISGYTKEELIGKSHNIIRHPNNPKDIYKQMWSVIRDQKSIWKGVIRNRTKSGKSYYVDCLIMPIIDEKGEIVEYISLRNDITDIMSPVKQLNDAIKNAQNPIVVYIKMEDYDMIEDFYDNETLFLIQTRAKESFEREFSKEFHFDKLYHLENGEYAFIVEKSSYKEDRDTLLSTLKTIQERMNKIPIYIDSNCYSISTIFSVALDGKKKFESAKLGIKKLLKDKSSLFIVADDLASIEQKRAQENMRIVHIIKDALNNSRIVSYFQPIVDNRSSKIIKYESLVRLIDSNNQVLSPHIFLETAKKSNLYSQITKEVLNHSFEMLRKFHIDISINLSAIDIEQDVTRETILNLLKSHKEFGSKIVFELLEDEKIKNLEVVKNFIEKVKKYGVKIAIDDFGVGHSNYERLLNYQPDILKIDGSLIKNITNNDFYCISVVKSIVTFAKEQNLKTVAEFIENEEIFRVIKELDIDYSQGYYFGKPKPLLLD